MADSCACIFVNILYFIQMNCTVELAYIFSFLIQSDRKCLEKVFLFNNLNNGIDLLYI